MQTREQKNIIVKDLAEKLKESKAIVFSDFKGLSVKNMTNLRRELRKEDISFDVVKKTLVNIALKETGIEMDANKLEGQIALAISKGDEVVAAKIIAKMAKANENLKIVGGFLGVKKLTSEEVNALAKLPSKKELLAKLVGTLNAPTSGLVNVLAGNLRSLINVLNSIKEAK